MKNQNRQPFNDNFLTYSTVRSPRRSYKQDSTNYSNLRQSMEDNNIDRAYPSELNSESKHYSFLRNTIGSPKDNHKD